MQDQIGIVASLLFFSSSSQLNPERSHMRSNPPPVDKNWHPRQTRDFLSEGPRTKSVRSKDGYDYFRNSINNFSDTVILTKSVCYSHKSEDAFVTHRDWLNYTCLQDANQRIQIYSLSRRKPSSDFNSN